MNIPPHEQRINRIVFAAVADRGPTAQAQAYEDLARLTRSDELAARLLGLAEQARVLARDSNQLRFDYGNES